MDLEEGVGRNTILRMMEIQQPLRGDVTCDVGRLTVMQMPEARSVAAGLECLENERLR